MDFIVLSAEYCIAYILAIATLQSPSSCYSLALPVFSCLIPARVTWINPLPCRLDSVCTSFGLSLGLALLDIVRRSQTYACPRITLCLTSHMFAVYRPMLFFMTTSSNKALQMDPHDSRFVTLLEHFLFMKGQSNVLFSFGLCTLSSIHHKHS